MDECWSASGLITGTPDNEDVGDHDVTVKVTDKPGATDTKTFTLTVNNVNDAPEFTLYCYSLPQQTRIQHLVSADSE